MSWDTVEIWMDIGNCFVGSHQLGNLDRNELLAVMVSAGIELDSLKAGQKLLGELMCLIGTPEDFQSWVSREAFGDIGNFTVTISRVIQMLEELNQRASSTHRDKYPPERAF